MEKGLVQIYTGDGKGKTTAALGQGLRASGRGYRVVMIQFLKGRDSGEIESIAKLEPNFKVYRFDKSKKFFWNMNDIEKKELSEKIEEAMEFARETLEKNQCDILILDEIMGVINNKILHTEKVVNLIEEKPDNIEVILTGRNVPEELYEIADLITEMKMVKHPFEKGISAREGIEF